MARVKPNKTLQSESKTNKLEKVQAIPDEEHNTLRKRGRPANPNKPIKLPSTRGRGRPRNDGVPIPPEEPRIKSTEKRGRGRPSKSGKRKPILKIKATGLGRGRPPKQVVNENEDDEDDEEDEEEGDSS